MAREGKMENLALNRFKPNFTGPPFREKGH
jgi:hypothetical protein